MKELRRILVVRTDRIGDVILTLPMLEILRKNFPHARLAVLIRRYTKDLVEGNTNVDEILFYDDGDTLLSFSTIVSVLRRGKFDAAFITYPRFRLACVVWWAGIPLRVGTGYRWYSFLFNKKVFVHRKVGERHEAEYNLDLLKAVGCEVAEVPVPRLEIPSHVLDDIRERLPRFGILPGRRIVILHPGSGGSGRNWSPARFAALGEKISRFPDVQVVVTGGKGENSLAESVAGLIGGGAVAVVNQLSLKEYAAFAKLASLLIANSTGPLHIAAAAGTPVIGLYSQVPAMSPRRWGPYTDRKTILVPKDKPTDCRTCTSAADCGCMDSITVDEVFDAARRYLSAEQFSLSQ